MNLRNPGVRRIGLFGGTFNPIHNGHLEIAERARKQFQLDEIFFVPTAIPPHKPKASLAPKTHRYRMVQLAIRPYPYFRISRKEMKGKAPSYAIDTLFAFKKQYGKTCALYYLLGLDAACELLTWKEPEQLLSSCEFILAHRQGSALPAFHAVLRRGKLLHYHNQFHPLSVTIPISANNIRQDIQQGKNWERNIPASVVKYIKKHKLYASDPKL